MKNFYLSLFVLFITDCVFAQTDSTGSIKAIVTSDNHTSLANTTVMLLSKDSQLVKIQLSDATGIATFADINPGDYLIKANHVGFKNFISADSIPVKKTKFQKQTFRWTHSPTNWKMLQCNRVNHLYNSAQIKR